MIIKVGFPVSLKCVLVRRTLENDGQLGLFLVKSIIIPQFQSVFKSISKLQDI